MNLPQTKGLSAVVIVSCLALGACGTSDEPMSPTSETAATEHVESSEAETSPEEVESVSESSEPEKSPAEEESSDPTDASSEDVNDDADLPPGSPEKYGEKVVSDRGATVKKINQFAGIGSLDGQDVWIDLRIVDIETDFQCTDPYASPSVNGNFIALTFEVETYPELVDADDPYFRMNQHEFRLISPDGTRENDSIGEGYSCLSAGERFPDQLGPGEKATGKVVLDSALTSGFLLYSYQGLPDWEWEF